MIISQSFLNIGHLQPREELLNVIQQILLNASDEEIQFFYKVLISYKELR